MRLGTRLDPRAEERLRRVSSSGGDEFVSRLTEGPIRTKSDRPKADVEPLVLDDLVGAAVLGGPHRRSHPGAARHQSADWQSSSRSILNQSFLRSYESVTQN